MFRSLRQPSTLHRVTAVFGVALVLLLSVLAASPELHAWVHGHEDVAQADGPGHTPVGDADHECAVTLFASGVNLLLFVCLLLLGRGLICSNAFRPGDWLIVARPRYWLVPSHAPPLV